MFVFSLFVLIYCSIMFNVLHTGTMVHNVTIEFVLFVNLSYYFNISFMFIGVMCPLMFNSILANNIEVYEQFFPPIFLHSAPTGRFDVRRQFANVAKQHHDKDIPVAAIPLRARFLQRRSPAASLVSERFGYGHESTATDPSDHRQTARPGTQRRAALEGEQQASATAAPTPHQLAQPAGQPDQSARAAASPWPAAAAAGGHAVRLRAAAAHIRGYGFGQRIRLLGQLPAPAGPGAAPPGAAEEAAPAAGAVPAPAADEQECRSTSADNDEPRYQEDGQRVQPAAQDGLQHDRERLDEESLRRVRRPDAALRSIAGLGSKQRRPSGRRR